MYDPSGRRTGVQSAAVHDGRVRFQLEQGNELPSGVYFFVLRDQRGGILATGKAVHER